MVNHRSLRISVIESKFLNSTETDVKPIAKQHGSPGLQHLKLFRVWGCMHPNLQQLRSCLGDFVLKVGVSGSPYESV